MTTSRTRRRSAVMLLATGAACLATSVLPLLTAQADDEPGSAFGSYSFAANAPVAQVRFDSAANQCPAAPAGPGSCEGVVNESVSTLRTGGIGHGLASVGWPGGLAGNLGSLAIVMGAPPEASQLNDPIKAENLSSGDKDTVTNTSVPGVTMTATATDTKAGAASTIGQDLSTPVSTFGRVHSESSTALTGVRSGVSTAHSEVQDVTIAGVLHLGTVVSDAKATTDGVKATATGRTTVTGASVNGVPVTIDERGITVQAQNVPLPSQATDAVNSALKQAGITVSLSTPVGKPEGAGVVYNAGSLVVVWAPQAGTTMSMAVGGAQVAATAEPGYVDNSGTVVDTGGTTGGTTGTTGVPTAVAPGLSGGSAGAPGLGSDSVPPPATGGSAPLTAAPASSVKGLPHGLSPWLGVLAVAGAALVMAGLRRLPDNVLVAPASACPQGDTA